MTLSQAIFTALETKLPDGSRVRHRVRNRTTEAPNVENTLRALNHAYPTKDYVFGTVCSFSPGQLQALVQPDDGSLEEIPDDMLHTWEISERQAPTGSEYLHGQTYWLAVGDHFYQIQHTSIQVKAMEEYLTWLLRDKSMVISKEYYVELKSTFDRAQVGDIGDVSAIEVGGLVPETVRPPEPSDANLGKDVEIDTRETLIDKVTAGFAKGREILDQLLGPVQAQRIIEAMPQDAALDVTVNIGYRAKKRKLKRSLCGT